MKKYLKIILITNGIAGLVLILLLTGIFFYLQSNHCRGLLLKKIDQFIPGHLEMEHINFSVLGGWFELGEVVLKDPEGRKLVGFKRFYFDITLTDFLKGRLTVKDLILDQPWGQLEINSHGELNLLKALPPPAKAKPAVVTEKKSLVLPFNIVLENFNLIDGSIQFVRDQLKISLEQINSKAEGNFWQQAARLQFVIGNSHLIGPGFAFDLKALELKTSYADDRLDLNIFKISLPGLDLILKGRVHELMQAKIFDLNLDLTTRLARVGKIMRPPLELGGHVKAGINLKGPWVNPEMSVRLDLKNGCWTTYQIDLMTLICDFKDRKFQIDNFMVQSPAGHIDLKGNADMKTAFAQGFPGQPNLDAITYNLNLQISDLLPGVLAPAEILAGCILADLKLQGRGIDPTTLKAQAELTTQVFGLVHNKLVPIDLEISTQLNCDDGEVQLEQLIYKMDGLCLEADGFYNQNSQQSNLNLLVEVPSLVDALSFTGFRDLAGQLKLDARVSGSIKNLLCSLEIKGQQLYFQDITIGDLAVKAGLNPQGEISIEELLLKNQGSQMKAVGSGKIFKENFKLVDDPKFDLKINSNLVRIQDFHSDYNGLVKFSVHGHGTKSDPQADVKLSVNQFESDFQDLKEILINAEFKDQKIKLHQVRIVPYKKEEFIAADGWVSLEQTYNLQFESPGIDLNSIDAAKSKLEELKISGRLGFDFTGTGSLANPDLTGQIHLTSLQTPDLPAGEILLKINIAEQYAKINGNLNEIKLKTGLDLKTFDFQTSLQMQKFRPDTYLALAGLTDFKGEISCRVQASGNINKPEDIAAEALIEEIALQFLEKDFMNIKNSKITYSHQKITVPGLHIVILEKGYFDLEGYTELNGSLAMNLKGLLPLEPLGNILEALPDIKGELLLSASAAGKIKAPEINCELEIKDTSLTIPELFQQINHLNARIQLTPHEIVIDKFAGFLDTGEFKIKGRADIENFQPVDLHLDLSLQKLPISVPDTLDILLNSELSLRGTPLKSQLKGEIVFLEGLYYKDVNLSPLQGLPKASRGEAPPPSEDTNPFLKNLTLDILVKQRQPFEVDNNVAQLKLTPDLQIKGNLNNISVAGRAEVKSGTITYSKKNFKVEKGVVDFLNPYKIDPNLDVRSSVNIRDWQIILEISGHPDQLLLQLSSEPKEEDEDILSLLMFEKTTAELINGEGGSSQSTQQMLAELIASTFGEDIKNKTGIDILEVETAENDQIKVTVGKNLSKRMTVKYAVETKDGIVIQQAISEYKLMENMLLKGFQESTGTFGGGLKFKLEFR